MLYVLLYGLFNFFVLFVKVIFFWVFFIIGLMLIFLVFVIDFEVKVEIIWGCLFFFWLDFFLELYEIVCFVFVIYFIVGL